MKMGCVDLRVVMRSPIFFHEGQKFFKKVTSFRSSETIDRVYKTVYIGAYEKGGMKLARGAVHWYFLIGIMRK